MAKEKVIKKDKVVKTKKVDSKLDIFKMMKNDNFVEIVDNSTEAENKLKKYADRDIVISLFTKDRIPDNIIESGQYHQFMINRWIASTKYYGKYKFIELMANINKYKLSNSMHYDLLFNELPYQEKCYPGYAWSKADDSTVDKNELIKALKWRYKYDRQGAEVAILVCSEKEINEIHDEYKSYCKSVGI